MELEEQRRLLLESFLDLTEETTEPEATAQQLLNAGVVTAREARTLAGVETLELEPGKVKCEYCDSIVNAGTNCPNCGAVLPAQDEVLYVADGQEFTLTEGEVPPFVQFCRIAHDLGSVVSAPPLTQRR